jgi:hypothetical protein
MGLPLAHIGGIPIEETLGSYGPVLLLAAGVATAWLSARMRHLRARKRRRAEGKRRPSQVKGAGDRAAR